ncbi:M1 family metallopeptidase [Flavobacterium sandaracinum]|uniref:M1 family peptidase n=1 Tax=Flavobacterium sandaracinum TaxID=2541733 RepID=A0A4R5CMD3_9FLAO|nr:M1 family metallopeptidase [Flavobacterium sandaracinum]TDE00380.1 M1 family peptidase [Flavobacterium sandaracinum]
MKKLLLFSFLTLSFGSLWAQNTGYWQQHVDYKMDVTMDVSNYGYKGTQELIYTNNSPDTLKKVYYHLYNNAFQPGSEMDARIQSIRDPDARMVNKIKVGSNEMKQSRIKMLKPNETGYLNITDFKQDGTTASVETVGTILEVTLVKPILPNSKTTFTLNFDGQVPIQIRRSGRNNAEGVALSMAQWYPKMAEFDFEGWHADPYIAREFHGVWGNFDVSITIDKDYVLGGTGYLQNKNEIGHGYQDSGVVVTVPKKAKTLTWHFKAPMVHDFTWAADKNYIHDIVQGPNGVDLHFLYKDNPKYIQNWKNLQPKTAQLMEFYNKTVGDYPYKQYSVIQGGDGGMEYAMCTLILGQGSFDGLLGVTAHEMAHSWFQHVLANNESKHGWMDEGFTSFLEDLGMNEIADKKVENPFAGAYAGYFSMVNSGKELPQSTHADRFDENRVYSITSYSKGELFLTQLMYLIGKENLMKSLKKYYNDFKFKHPTPNDIKRSAERISGANLDWYLTDWTQTTNTIDYGIREPRDIGEKTIVTLERIGRMPMPIDLLVEYTDGTMESFYIPLRMMSFEKQNPNPAIKRTILGDWAWAYPTMEFMIAKPKSTIKKITIDPSGLMADIKKENNVYKQ